jgi:hypothetical protein
MERQKMKVDLHFMPNRKKNRMGVAHEIPDGVALVADIPMPAVVEEAAEVDVDK